MDIKLKNYKMYGKHWWFDFFLWVMTILSGTLFGLTMTTMVSVSELADFDSLSDEIKKEVLSGMENDNVGWWDDRIVKFINGEDGQSDFMFKLMVIAVCIGLIFLITLVGTLIYTGKFNRSSEGVIQLNWFDKIPSEIQVTILCLPVVLGVWTNFPISQLIACQDWFGVYEPLVENKRLFGIENENVIMTMTVLCILAIAIALTIGVSIIKKIKAKKFFSYSIIGIVITWLAQILNAITTKGTDKRKTIIIYVLISLLMVALAMTWVGAILDVVFICYYIPKRVGKFHEILAGVDEIKNGNLEYVVPVIMGKEGPKSDLDILAKNINEISQSANIAVQNELKNQRLKTDLISNVSHDLKTPLTSIISYVDLLKKENRGDKDPEKIESYINILDEKSHRLKVLTENLFEAAKASSGNIPVKLEKIDLMEIVNQSLAEMDNRFKETGLEVIVNKRTENTMVTADGQLLWRVIENTFTNIYKYALPNSRVYLDISDVGNRNYEHKKTEDNQDKDTKIRLNKEDNRGSYDSGDIVNGYTLLEIKNISKDRLNISEEELMERFKRGDESRNTEGSGLGLTISKDLTKNMDGAFEISVDGDLFKTSIMLKK